MLIVKLFEVGSFLHLSGNGRVIINVKSEISNRTILYNSDGVKVAKVAELFGPVKKPYISAIPLKKDLGKEKGMKIFIKNK